MSAEDDAKISIRRLCEHTFESQKQEHASGFLDDDPPHRQLVDPTEFALLTTPTPREMAEKIIEYGEKILSHQQDLVTLDVSGINVIDSMRMEKQLCLSRSALFALDLTNTVSVNQQEHKDIKIKDREGLQGLCNILRKFIQSGVFGEHRESRQDHVWRPRAERRMENATTLENS